MSCLKKIPKNSMNSQDKKVKRTVITAKNTKTSKEDGNHDQNTNKNKTYFTQKQIESSIYRLSRVKNNIGSNRTFEKEIQEPFSSSFFRDHPEMLDMRTPSEKLTEYYSKFNQNTESSNQKNKLTKIEQIKLLSQIIILEEMVHGINSFDVLKVHVMLASLYNRTHKPEPAKRHLENAKQIQQELQQIEMAESKLSKNHQISNQKSESNYTKEDERAIIDEIAIEYANSILLITKSKSGNATKNLTNVILSLSSFDETSNLEDWLIGRKNLAQARLLFLQQKFEESFKAYEKVLSIYSKNVKITRRPKKDHEIEQIEEFADLKLESAENLSMIIQRQMNIHFQSLDAINELINQINYGLDYYSEIYHMYSTINFEDQQDKTTSFIRKLEGYLDELEIRKQLNPPLPQESEQNNNETNINNNSNSEHLEEQHPEQVEQIKTVNLEPNIDPETIIDDISTPINTIANETQNHDLNDQEIELHNTQNEIDSTKDNKGCIKEETECNNNLLNISILNKLIDNTADNDEMRKEQSISSDNKEETVLCQDNINHDSQSNSSTSKKKMEGANRVYNQSLNDDSKQSNENGENIDPNQNNNAESDEETFVDDHVSEGIESRNIDDTENQIKSLSDKENEIPNENESFINDHENRAVIDDKIGSGNDILSSTDNDKNDIHNSEIISNDEKDNPNANKNEGNSSENSNKDSENTENDAQKDLSTKSNETNSTDTSNENSDSKNDIQLDDPFLDDE